MRIRILAAIYVGILCAIVFLASQRDTQFLFAGVRSIPGGDRVGHFLLMGTASFVVNLALEARRTRLFGRHVLMGSVAVGAVVALEECSQLFVRGRTFDLVDLACDFAGVFLFGQAAAFVVRRARSARA